jgi:hypothetical protein
MKHSEASPLSNKTVTLKKTFDHPGVVNDGQLKFDVEDWWDRIAGKSWMDCNGHPACMNYAMRTGFSKTPIPTDNEVLYGKIDCLGFLVHVSEIEQ